MSARSAQVHPCALREADRPVTRGDQVKIRKGWKIIWPDGTEWIGDCARWAASPIMPGARRVSVRIMGTGKWPCPECAHGTHR